MKKVKTILSELMDNEVIVSQGERRGCQYIKRIPRVLNIQFYDNYVPEHTKVEERIECIGIMERSTGKIYKSVDEIPHRLRFKPRKKGPGRKPKAPLECIYSSVKKETHIPATILGKAFDEYQIVPRGGISTDKFKYANKVVKLVRYEYDYATDTNTIKLVISR